MQSYLSTPSSKTGVSIASNNRTKSAKVLEGRLKTKKLESATQGRESFYVLTCYGADQTGCACGKETTKKKCCFI